MKVHGNEASRAELERLSAELTTLGEDNEFCTSQFEPALKPSPRA